MLRFTVRQELYNYIIKRLSVLETIKAINYLRLYLWCEYLFLEHWPKHIDKETKFNNWKQKLQTNVLI